jgi:hypothetical protein
MLWQGTGSKDYRQGEMLKMEDGRQIISETYKVIRGIAEELEQLKKDSPEASLSDVEQYIESSLSWAKRCLNKVWLRSSEGTQLAKGCLDAANELKAKAANPASALEEAINLSAKLESLARIIATKASVMT